jgi:hypothetical protein
MKQAFKILFAFTFCFLAFSGCKKENLCDCFKSTGHEVSVYREISGFQNVSMEGKVEVHIIESPVFEVKIVGGQHVVGLIKTEVVDGELKISNHNKCNMMRSYKKKIHVYVKMPKVGWLRNHGLGNIWCDNALTTDTVYYQVTNSGDIHLKVNNMAVMGGIHGMGDIYLDGATAYHNSNINGEGFLHGENCKTDVSDLVLITSGVSKVDARVKLIVNIEQSGDVYYTGNPGVIQKTITGTGKLISY